MKKNRKYLLLIPIVAVLSFACNDYIQNVDPLITQAQDELLNNETQLPFLMTGVKQRFSTVASQISCLADLLSDQMFYTSDNPQASFPTFEEIDKGQILLDNNSNRGMWRVLGELRFFADDLIRRTNSISISNAANKNAALFTGYFYGGIARFYMAVYYGLAQTQPGGVIDAGPFIPQSQMLDQAIANFKSAITSSAKDADTRIVNSFIAKAYLVKGDFANAATYAAIGMAKGDADFLALYNDVSNIYYWGFAGKGRVQIVVDNRMNDYITADPKEANRIKLSTLKGTSGKTYYFQTKYPDKFSNFPVMTWQENNLMLAELALRGFGSGNALALVNEVRASHSVGPLVIIDLNGVLTERDKELCFQGDRLIDENRTGKWHLAAGTWQYLPITSDERNANPNLK